MTRRKFLSIAGGGVILAAAAAAWPSAPPEATAPWRDAGRGSDPRRKALSYAVLAPSAHNLQPWLVDLSVANEVRLFVDRAKLIPAADPFERQTMIGLGSFLELLVMAAAADGWSTTVSDFPEGVARVVFAKDASLFADPLFRHVLARRTYKEPFTERAVPGSALDVVRNAAANGVTIGASNDDRLVRALRDLTGRAYEVEMTTSAHAESVGHYRLGKKEIEANPDGIPFRGPMLETLIAVGQFSRERALDRSSKVYASTRTLGLAQTHSAMGHIWIVTKANARADQLAAGRDWVRAHLSATELGLGVHPLSAALEEMPEMDAIRREAHELLAPGGGTLQMLARVGFGEAPDPTPRWSLDHKLIGARS